MALKKVLLYGVYGIASFYVFLKVYETSLLVIDEEFHLRQGMHYCNGDFGEVYSYRIWCVGGKQIINFYSILVGSKNHNVSWTIFDVYFILLPVWCLQHVYAKAHFAVVFNCKCLVDLRDQKTCAGTGMLNKEKAYTVCVSSPHSKLILLGISN